MSYSLIDDSRGSGEEDLDSGDESNDVTVARRRVVVVEGSRVFAVRENLCRSCRLGRIYWKRFLCVKLRWGIVAGEGEWDVGTLCSSLTPVPVLIYRRI